MPHTGLVGSAARPNRERDRSDLQLDLVERPSDPCSRAANLRRRRHLSPRPPASARLPRSGRYLRHICADRGSFEDSVTVDVSTGLRCAGAKPEVRDRQSYSYWSETRPHAVALFVPGIAAARMDARRVRPWIVLGDGEQAVQEP